MESVHNLKYFSFFYILQSSNGFVPHNRFFSFWGGGDLLLLSLPQHHCHAIVVTSSLSHHHCHNIIVAPPLSHHHCHTIIVTPPLSHHHCHIIIVTPLLTHHHCHNIIVTPSLSHHHCHTTIVTPSLSHHHCHAIVVAPPLSHHHCRTIIVTPSLSQHQKKFKTVQSKKVIITNVMSSFRSEGHTILKLFVETFHTNFTELSMEMPLWCPFASAPTWWPEIKTSSTHFCNKGDCSFLTILQYINT